MEEKIDAGHVTSEWGMMFLREMTGISLLFNSMSKVFPGPVTEEGPSISQSEKEGLDMAFKAVRRIQEIAAKLDDVMGPAISQSWHEELRASIRLIHSEWGAA